MLTVTDVLVTGQQRVHPWNHQRVYRTNCALELNLRIKPRKRLKRDKPDARSVSEAPILTWSSMSVGPVAASSALAGGGAPASTIAAIAANISLRTTMFVLR